MTAAVWQVDRYCPACGHPLAEHGNETCGVDTGGGRGCPCDRFATPTEPSMYERVMAACAEIELAPDYPASYHALIDTWVAFRESIDWPGDNVDSIEVTDPATWNPASPLYTLLRMAAAGDLTPLADALWAARSGEPKPARQVGS